MAGTGSSEAVLTARSAGYVACLHCGQVWPPEQEQCPHCGSELHSRYPKSMQRVWAWWFAGLITYFPANLYPMMVIDSLASKSSSTILEGVVELTHHHAYFVAIVVFVASIVIPTLKFIAVGYLAYAVQRPVPTSKHVLHKLYEVVEFIGRWSMIDVFVVAILSALVHLGTVVDIFPGIAAVSFALTVIFTMLSALSFDPRLIWDRLETEEAEA